MSFRVGQSVMCINADVSASWVVIGVPLELGKVYTIRAVRDDLKDERSEQRIGPAVRLVENEIYAKKWPKEQFWMAERFRALDDVTTAKSVQAEAAVAWAKLKL